MTIKATRPGSGGTHPNTHGMTFDIDTGSLHVADGTPIAGRAAARAAQEAKLAAEDVSWQKFHDVHSPGINAAHREVPGYDVVLNANGEQERRNTVSRYDADGNFVSQGYTVVPNAPHWRDQ